MIEKVEISKVCEVIAGQSPPSTSYNSDGEGVPFFQGKADFGLLYPAVRYWCTEPKKISKPGDILFSVRAPVGPTNINNIDASIGRGLAAIRCGKSIDTKYLLHFLRFSENRITNLGTGSTFSAITIGTLKSIQIPLPPLATQKKIAAILDAADAHRQKTKQLLAKYDELAQSIFLDMFGDPVTNPKGWEKVATIVHSDCIVPGRDKPKSFSGEIPWITTADLNHLGYTRKSRLNIGLSDLEVKEVRARIIPKDSVIMTCVGDLGVVSINKRDVVMNQQLHAFICGEKFNNVFLMYNLSYQTPYMFKMASSTTVPYMNKTVANNTPAIVPPILLQDQFADLIKVINSQKERAESSLKMSENLFKSLLQKAFKGELLS